MDEERMTTNAEQIVNLLFCVIPHFWSVFAALWQFCRTNPIYFVSQFTFIRVHS